MKKALLLLLVLAILAAGGLWLSARPGHSGMSEGSRRVGDKIDEFQGVAVYYNGRVGNVSGRNSAPDGYNIGQKYQCVEFVKRYFLEARGHKMPNPWGHARDFFNPALADGALNLDRGLRQYKNGGRTRPEPGDLLVLAGHIANRHGHVGIICAVGENYAEMIQQNPGPREPSRVKIPLRRMPDADAERWQLDNRRVLGWLRLAD